MLTAKQLWEKRSLRHSQALTDALEKIEEALFRAEPVDHESGVRMLDVSLPIRDLGLDQRGLKSLLKTLETKGYTAALKSESGWPTDEEETPVWLDITTFEEKKKPKKKK